MVVDGIERNPRIEIYELKTGTNSDTHDQGRRPAHDKLECKRCANGKEIENPPDDANTKFHFSLWHHITKKDISKIPDDVFRNVLSIPEKPIIFTFYQKSHKK
uniref:CdiA_C domain-containing protein n=1 Tax=Strongyloides papillosus TaxID=174720 RepID=A0A0N5CHL8_STREA